MQNELINEVLRVCGNNNDKVCEFANDLGLRNHSGNWWQAAFDIATKCGSVAEIHRLAYAD